MRAGVVLGLLAGCGRLGFDVGTGAVPDDAAMDAGDALVDEMRPDADVSGPFVPSNLVSWTVVAGTSAVSIDAMYTIDTDTGAISNVSGGLDLRGPGAGVISGIRYEQATGNLGVFGVDQISIGASLRAIGSRTLVIVSNTTVTIGGFIDLHGGICGTNDTSCAGAGGGTGGNSNTVATGCGAGGAGVMAARTGGGGAGGGTLGGRGGAEIGAGGGAPGGSAGAPCTSSLFIAIAGGAGGGRGGGAGGGEAGNGGGGGGALQITARNEITVAGQIDAGAAGGRGSGISGGGGGGAGGVILLEAPNVMVSGTLTANGGGGGEGEGGGNGEPARRDTMAANGGSSGGNPGGRGGAAGLPPTSGASSTNDTGAGGGAVGRIHLRGTTTSFATASPTPTTSTL